MSGSAQANEAGGAAPALVPLEIEVYAEEGQAIPHFMVDAAWPDMPAEMIIGQVPGLAVDKGDNVWLVHRPQSLTFSDVGLAQSPPQALCCRPGPDVMKFSGDGTYLGGWTGDPEWPETVHGIHVDDEQTVWIGGNGEGDHVVYNFTEDGDFIRQVGTHGETDGNASPDKLGNPADIWRGLGQVFIADGYINKRIAGFDEESLGFQGAWGAYGTVPSGGTRQGSFDQSQASTNTDGGADPDAKAFGDIVHCVVGTDDGYVYVCDRRNNRAQMFRVSDTGDLEFVRDIVIAPETGGTRTVTDIAFSPDGAFVYVADMMNSTIWVLDRSTHEPVARIGRIGRYPGEFTWLHSLDVDSEGNIYTSEVGTGRRVQKLVFTGMKPASE
ncbi:beta-propeller fold lactonase family protein [Henriciella aquimarina]|uniref:beta-propeller fold lactonase family protein n=1 Tax=Henriciella aquimarina TaxID=545261 RepID=UPI001F24864B|nr:beta-propeller fold lactonase family protein [Henriciella aquimarina]